MRDLRNFVEGKTMGRPSQLDDRMDEKGRQKSKALKVKTPQMSSTQPRPKHASAKRPPSRGKQPTDYDAFDTDAEGLEDNTASYVQVEDSQTEPHGRAVAQRRHDQHPESDFPLDNSVQNIDMDQTQDHTLNGGDMIAFSTAQDHENAYGDAFGYDESYPATTSGRPDEEEAADEEEHVLRHNSHNLPQPLIQPQMQHLRRSLGASAMPQQATPRIQHNTQAYSRVPAMPKKEANVPSKISRPQQQGQLPLRDFSPARAIPAAQSFQDAQSLGISLQTQGTHRFGGLQPARSAIPPVQPDKLSGPKPNRPTTGHALQPLPQATNVQPVASMHVEEEQHTEDQLDMGLDYRTDELRQLPYIKLQQESLDYDPNAPRSVLPSGMENKPLADRLVAAHRLDPDKQSAFFATLSLHEWEDAGDWFADQFSCLIGKFRDARRQKREAVRGFEEEIHRRHTTIEKRKHVIEDAMVNMKNDGQGLLRGSTPAQKRRRV